jgi:HEAT repeat protein
MSDVQIAPLPSDVAARLTAFARACKGAARAASLYPPEHPAVAEALDRLTEAARAVTESGPLTMLVIPNNLLVDGCALGRQDLAVADLAALLHAHRVGEITIQRDVSPSAWRTLVALLGQDPAGLHLRGGLSRTLTTDGAIGIAVTEIDYASLFDSDGTGSRGLPDPASLNSATDKAEVAAAWATVVARCLEGRAPDLDEATLRLLGAIAHDPARLAEFFGRVEEQAGDQTLQKMSRALLSTMQRVVDHLEREDPAGLDAALGNMASAFARLSPDLVLEIAGPCAVAGSEHASLVAALTGRIDDRTLARFVSRSVAHERHASARLAEAVRTLAPDSGHRRAIAPLVHEELARTRACEDTSFDSLWSQVADLLTTYSDTAYVPPSYDRELTAARQRAADLTQASDDPPERVTAWLKTVSDSSVRELDLKMLADLIVVQHVDDRRRDALDLVMTQVGDLVDLGDFEGARQLTDAAIGQSRALKVAGETDDVGEALDELARGKFLSRVASHLHAARDSEFEQIKALCADIGPALVPRLAEALSVEDRPRARRRLADLMVAFGDHGNASVQQLVESPHAGVRKTAVQLLRLRGGAEATPGLARLAADIDADVRHEAVRAILGLGGDESFDTLCAILFDAAHRGRMALIEELATTREHRAVPLLCHIVQRLECRGDVRPVYLRSLVRLGALGAQDAVDALSDVLNRGRLWAPFRTREVRSAAAAALAQMTWPSAREALEHAAESGSFGVRAAARKYLRRA